MRGTMVKERRLELQDAGGSGKIVSHDDEKIQLGLGSGEICQYQDPFSAVRAWERDPGQPNKQQMEQLMKVLKCAMNLCLHYVGEDAHYDKKFIGHPPAKL